MIDMQSRSRIEKSGKGILNVDVSVPLREAPAWDPYSRASVMAVLPTSTPLWTLISGSALCCGNTPTTCLAWPNRLPPAATTCPFTVPLLSPRPLTKHFRSTPLDVLPAPTAVLSPSALHPSLRPLPSSFRANTCTLPPSVLFASLAIACLP